MSINGKFAPHVFSDLDTATFNPEAYSWLKFGSIPSANNMAQEIAQAMFSASDQNVRDAVNAARLVIVTSPYDHVKNAATMMGEVLLDVINVERAKRGQAAAELVRVRRKLSYTADFGFLTALERQQLIANDTFIVNPRDFDDAYIMFVDDVYITGAHERRLLEVFESFVNPKLFVYYGIYEGTHSQIEAKINLYGITSVEDYIRCMISPQYKTIIRPIKYMLNLNDTEFQYANKMIMRYRPARIREFVSGALAENYHLKGEQFLAKIRAMW